MASTSAGAVNNFAAARAALEGNVEGVRQAFRAWFSDPIVCTPTPRGVRFEGQIGIQALVGELVIPELVPVTTGTSVH